MEHVAVFFSGLFSLVGVLEEKGAIEWIARNIFLRIGHNPYAMVLMVLWVSGIVSGFIDNIPYAITIFEFMRISAIATIISLVISSVILMSNMLILQ
ncbi:MAG: SLC13 family permease [Desulfobacterales bacterium]